MESKAGFFRGSTEQVLVSNFSGEGTQHPKNSRSLCFCHPPPLYHYRMRKQFPYGMPKPAPIL